MSEFNSIHADKCDEIYSKKNYLGVSAFVEAAVKRYASIAPTRLVGGKSVCGTDTQEIELARCGYKVTSVHFSQSMHDHVPVMNTIGLSGGKCYSVGNRMYPWSLYCPSGMASIDEKIERVSKAVLEVLG